MLDWLAAFMVSIDNFNANIGIEAMLAVGQTLIKALAARLTQLLEATAERG